MIHDCSFVCVGCSWVPCLFWTVELSTVLQTNPPRSVDSAVTSILHIWTLSSSDCMIWDPSFHTEDNWWTQTQLLKSFKHSLMLQKETRCIRAGCWKLLNRMKISSFFLLLKYIFFSIYYCPSEATEDTCMFPGRQIKYNLPWSSNSKSFHPPALNASCFACHCIYIYIYIYVCVSECVPALGLHELVHSQGWAAAGRTSSVKHVPNRLCGSLRCGDPL